MHPVEFAPLPRCQRTKNRMIHNPPACAEPLFAASDGSIHGDKLRPNRLYDFFCSHASRPGSLWRLPSVRHIPQPDYDSGPDAILQSGRPCQRLLLLQAALATFQRSSIRQVEVLQNFRRAPLSFWMKLKLLGGHVAYRFSDGVLQFFQITIQALTPQGSCFAMQKP